MSNCHTPEITALVEEVESLLNSRENDTDFIISDNLIRISDDLVSVLSTTEIFSNDVSSVIKILDGVIM